MCLPAELQSRLHDSWRINPRRDPSEPVWPRVASEAPVGTAEPCPIEGIEHFPAELYIVALLKGDVLENPLLEVVLPRRLPNVPAGVAERTRALDWKAAGLKYCCDQLFFDP